MPLQSLGWTERLAAAFVPFAARGLQPARVAVEHRSRYVVYSADGEHHAVLAGRLRHESDRAASHPVVGDWVVLAPPARHGRLAVIDALLPRSTRFARRAPLRTHTEQVVAANVDRVLVVTAADRDANVRRLERYLAMAWEGGAQPVIVLSKCDLERADELWREIHAIACGVPVLRVSNATGAGLDDVRALVPPGITAALLGSSGVGKSSLVNSLLGHARLRTAAVRDDGKGRHTTTHRELVPLPGGGLLLDTPGMRELGLWDAADGAREAFPDVAALAERCRFGDCRHLSEPDCAVRDAAEAGLISAERLGGWRKLMGELEYLEQRNDARARSENGRRDAAASRLLRARMRDKYS